MGKRKIRIFCCLQGGRRFLFSIFPFFRFSFLVLSAALSSGCILFVSVPPLEPLPQSKVVLHDVHYVHQQTNWDCGPACLTTMMRHYGSNLTLPEVTAQLKRADDGGTIIVEMIYGARNNGFRATLLEGSINELRRLILAGKPVILFLHYMPDITRRIGRRGHYVVAVGYDDGEREAVIHTGTTAFDTMSYRRLQLQWSRTGFLGLLVEK